MGWDAGPAPHPVGPHADLAGRWSAALREGVRDHIVPMNAADAHLLLTELARELDAAAGCSPLPVDRIAAVGARLAGSQFIGSEVLGRSIAVLGRHFGLDAADVLAAFATGYLHAFRGWLLTEQENVMAAEVTSRRATEEQLRVSEARLRAVFAQAGDLRERLDYRANHDQLTGLPNRSRFFDTLRAAFAEPGARVGLCYVDLDHFKSVNDTFGHAAGDELLIQTAARLSACAALPGQFVARMGGDEFVVLISRPLGDSDASALARTILDALARPFDVRGHHLSVTASIGVIEDRGHHATADELLQAADTTMYWAKAAGRDRYTVFDPDRGELEHTRAELSAAMPASFTRGEFFLDYQPIVALPDRGLVAVEALVRWRHPELGVLPPGRFVDLAEDNGHIDALGALVLELACRDSRRWYDRFPEHTPTVSVNVSAAEVADPDWLERVQRIIAETGIPPERLQLELTERTFMETTGRPLEALRTLAEEGIRIAIDDFGTGYSNLAYLGQLPLHVVKLAGPFVQRIRTPETVNRTDLLVLETIIGLTHDLGLTVTAECVETGYQAERLHALGCDTAQGWHFHRPMPADRITELLAEPAVDSAR